MGYFCLDDYDCIGFDMDHTVIQYDLPALSKLIYKCLIEYLRDKNTYDSDLLKLEDFEKYKDWCAKGLIFDYMKGNFIKIDSNGYVLSCSHGLKQLDDAGIVEEYGKDRIWSSISVLKDTMLNGPGYSIIENYYTMPAIPLLSILINNSDSKCGFRMDNYLSIWKDIVEAFDLNFSYTSFKSRKGLFMSALIEHPEKYVKKCPSSVCNWIKGLRKTKTTLLITHTFENLAEHLMKYAIGPEWKTYFDFVIGHARKPKFFHEASKDNDFHTMTTDEEMSDVPVTELKPHIFYLCGSSRRLEKEMQRHLQTDRELKFLYFGDSIRSDVHAPTFHTDWHTVAVVEELKHTVDSIVENDDYNVATKKVKLSSEGQNCITTSKLWGSFFLHQKENGDGSKTKNTAEETNTFFADIVEKYSRLAIPLLDYLTEIPVDYRITYSGDKEFAFYPSCSPSSIN